MSKQSREAKSAIAMVCTIDHKLKRGPLPVEIKWLGELGKHPDDVIPELMNSDKVQMHMQILLESSQQNSVGISSFHPQVVQLRMHDVTQLVLLCCVSFKLA